MREDMKTKLMAVLARQNPALAALVAAPELTDTKASETLAEAFRCAPWAKEALEAVEATRPGTAKRYAAALAQENGAGYEAIFDQLSREATALSPF